MLVIFKNPGSLSCGNINCVANKQKFSMYISLFSVTKSVRFGVGFYTSIPVSDFAPTSHAQTMLRNDAHVFVQVFGAYLWYVSKCNRDRITCQTDDRTKALGILVALERAHRWCRRLGASSVRTCTIRSCVMLR